LDLALAALLAEDRERPYHARDVALMRSDLSELNAVFYAVLSG
jgi:hypothetical protein